MLRIPNTWARKWDTMWEVERHDRNECIWEHNRNTNIMNVLEMKTPIGIAASVRTQRYPMMDANVVRAKKASTECMMVFFTGFHQNMTETHDCKNKRVVNAGGASRW